MPGLFERLKNAVASTKAQLVEQMAAGVLSHDLARQLLANGVVQAGGVFLREEPR